MALTPNPQPAFEPGDRVQERYGWPQHGRDGESAVKRFGRVIRSQPTLPNGKGEHAWQYTVQWDGDPHQSHGYLGPGLVRLAPCPTATTVIPTMANQIDEPNKITRDEIDRENRRLLKRLVDVVPTPQVKS